MDWPTFVRKRCMTEDKEGRGEELSMVLINIVTIVIIITFRNHGSSTNGDTKSSVLVSKIGTPLRAFNSLLQRFVTSDAFDMQQFGTQPKGSGTTRTFTLTNYYQPL